MPNHVTNILSIQGPDDVVAKVLLSIRNEVSEDTTLFIDFNKIYPLPEELKDTSAPPKIVTQEQYDAHKKRIEEGDLEEHEKKFGVTMPLTEEMRDDLLMKYGAADWYNWQVENWGTKWNAYEQELTDDGRIIFQTAWSTPHLLIEKLSMKFPECVFTVKFADEDFGHNTGQYSFENGEEGETYIPQGGSVDAIKMAYQVSDEAYGSQSLTYYLEDVSEEDMESEWIKNIIQCVYDLELVGEYAEPVWEALNKLCVENENYEFAQTLIGFKEKWAE